MGLTRYKLDVDNVIFEYIVDAIRQNSIEDSKLHSLASLIEKGTEYYNSADDETLAFSIVNNPLYSYIMSHKIGTINFWLNVKNDTRDKLKNMQTRLHNISDVKYKMNNILLFVIYIDGFSHN